MDILTGSWNVGTLWKWLSDNAYLTVDSPKPRYYSCTKNLLARQTYGYKNTKFLFVVGKKVENISI
jgi:hypothetical protein